MAVTIKDIALKAGVSRGTVDRVLHNRPGVKPEVVELVRKIASEMGFSPNRAGMILAARKQPLTIGYVYPGAGNSFFDDVISGFNAAAKVYDHYGVRLVSREVCGFDVKDHIAAMKQLIAEHSCQALCVTTVNVPEMQTFINKLIDSGIVVVAVNTDLSYTKRLCYIGSDYYKAGCTAAGLLTLIGIKDLEILIVTGSFNIKGHTDRMNGFKATLKKNNVPFHVSNTIESLDNDEHAYECTLHAIKEHPEINCIYIAGAGVSGTCQAVLKLKRENKIRILTHDETPSIKNLVMRGVIDFTIGQEPYRQGHKAIEMVFDYFISNKTKVPHDLITDTLIKIKNNI